MDPKTVVLDISSDEEDSNFLTKLLADDYDEVVVVKECEKLKLKSSVVESDDDECVVLDKDPNAAVEVRNGNGGGGGGGDDEDEIVVVSEKGQVACRDYPHSRHLCIKFPFSTTPNQTHCNQCYCYVCDSLAPCVYWGNGSSSIDHCRATDKDQFWILERKNAKNGTKTAQPVSQPPPVNRYIPPPVMNQIPKSTPINHHRNQVHPELLSRIVIRAQQKYNQNSTLHRPVFKRTHPLRAAAVGHQSRYSSYRGNLGNPVLPNAYQVNGMLSGSSNYVGSLQQPNAVNAFAPYPPQSQTFTPQFSNQLNPSFQSHVNSNLLYQQPVFPPPPPSSQPQPQSQPGSSQLTYTVPVQPSYHVQSKTLVDSPLVPVSDVTQNVSQPNLPQDPVVDSGFKDYGLGLPTGQDSGGDAVVSGLADYQFDWIFDNQPIDPGFTDYSSDSAFIDTGPIFQF